MVSQHKDTHCSWCTACTRTALKLFIHYAQILFLLQLCPDLEWPLLKMLYSPRNYSFPVWLLQRFLDTLVRVVKCPWLYPTTFPDPLGRPTDTPLPSSFCCNADLPRKIPAAPQLATINDEYSYLFILVGRCLLHWFAETFFAISNSYEPSNYLLRWYIICSLNVFMSRCTFGAFHPSEGFCVTIASVSLSYTLAEVQTCSSTSTSGSLLNTCQAYIRISYGFALITQLRTTSHSITLLSFGKSRQALTAKKVAAQASKTKFRGFGKSAEPPLSMIGSSVLGSLKASTWIVLTSTCSRILNV